MIQTGSGVLRAGSPMDAAAVIVALAIVVGSGSSSSSRAGAAVVALAGALHAARIGSRQTMTWTKISTPTRSARTVLSRSSSARNARK